MDLSDDDIRTASAVPQIDPETLEMGMETRDVSQCSDCSAVIGIGD